MDAIIRVVVMYGVLLLAFRIAGKRAMSEATTFDLLMLLVLSETTQQALIGEDHSVTHAVLLVTTFLTLDVALGALKYRHDRVDRLLEGAPDVLIAQGAVVQAALDDNHIDENDILEAARQSRGIERLEDVKTAILERTGKISIVPW